MSSSSSEVVRKELDEDEESEELPSSSLSSSDEALALPFPFAETASAEADFACDVPVAIFEVDATGCTGRQGQRRDGISPLIQ